MGILKLEFDVITRELGDFGAYQIRQYILLCLPIVFSAAFNLSFVFTAGVVPHRCLVEQCGDESATSPFLPSWWAEAIPPDNDGGPSSCSMYESLNTTMTTVASSFLDSTCSVPFDNSSVLTCDQWVYDGVERTILTEFKLTCPQNAWKLTLVGSINSFGRLVGLPFSGYLSDRFGRKWALIVTLFGATIMGLARALSSSYVMFVTFEFLEEFFSGSTYAIAFIMTMELMSTKRRTLSGGMAVWSFALGEVLLGLIAWTWRDWRYILLTIYIPSIFFLVYVWVLDESIRWLIIQKRGMKARVTIEKAAKMNKLKISNDLQKILDDLTHVTPTDHVTSTEQEEQEEQSILKALRQIMHSRSMLLCLANCCVSWITAELIYYGLSLNSVSLAGLQNIYLNFVLVSLMEIPAYIIVWFGMNHIGRRLTICLTFLVSGVACLIQPFIPASLSGVQLTFYLIGKLGISGAISTLWVYTAELFPTEIRTTMLSLCCLVGRVGSMLAPQTPLLTYISPLLPMVLFGALALVASLLALLFPETKDRSLPESVKETTDSVTSTTT